MAAPVVKFKRILKPGVKDGEDIRAVKIVVSRFGCWPWMQFDDVWHTGPATFSAQAIPCARRKLGMVKGNIYNQALHDSLLKKRVPDGSPHEGEWVWNQTALNLYNGYQDFTLAEGIVVDIFNEWKCMEKVEPKWHYGQRRPNDYTTPCENGGTADCSGTCLRTARRAGCQPIDPVWGWGGGGNTDSLRRGGFAISNSDVIRYCKDHYVLGFYGTSWDATDHVVACEAPGIWHSFGSEAGPLIYSTIYYGHHSPFLGHRAYRVI